MSIPAANTSTGRSNHPVATEFALVVALLLGSYLWQRVIVQSLVNPIESSPTPGGLPALILLTGGLIVAGLAVFTAAYVSVRDIEIGLALPSNDELALVGVAAVLPVVLVGITKFLGVLTGVQFNSLSRTWYGEASVTSFLLVAGLSTLVAVPVLLLSCQVLVQGSFEKAVDDDVAIVLTTLVTGFMLLSGAGGIDLVPDQGKLAGGVLFVLALGVALYASENANRERLRYLAYIPILALIALTILSGIAEIESIAEGLFITTHVAVLAIAAYTYDRTDSLLVPALAYLSLLLTSDVVVFFFDARMGSW